MTGFEFFETMAGSYSLDASPDRERTMSITVRARADSILRFLRDHQATIEGEVDMEGFADHRPLRGSLVIDPLFGKIIAYAFTFAANDGRACKFEGTKRIQFSRFVATMTTLPGEITDATTAEKLASAVIRFDVRGDLGKFVRSWHPTPT